MKIVLLGPTYPFRGGISHYTTLLCRTLRQNHEVKFVSFKRQYPKFFFPGTSDKDTSKNPVKVDNVDYIIDSMNPLTWLSAACAIKRYKPEKIILPWWVAFWTPQFWAILSLVKQSIKCEIVFICHNVVEHESNFIKRLATKIVLSKGDRFITHSKQETRNLNDLLGKDVNSVTAFHPTYTDLSKRKYSKPQAKEMLGLTGDVLLFFGFVREYKGLSILLDAMPAIIQNKQATLLIVGEFWKDKQKYLDQVDRFGISSRVRIHDKYVPNEEIGLYFAASDLVVQPYITVSGSGISQVAYGFDRPVIATNVGNLSEVVEDGVNGRMVESENSQDLAKVILESLNPDTLEMLSRNAARTKEKFSWERMGQIIVRDIR